MTIEQLNELNIFALREMARKAGVSSPTSKVKNVLISEILNIASGKQKPVTSNTKGRPPKSNKYKAEEFFSFVADEEVVSKKIVLKQTCNLDENTQMFNVTGYVEATNENISFLWLENKNGKFIKYYIPNDDKLNFNLRTGDLVEAKAYMQENQIMIDKILTINGFGIEKLSNLRNNYDALVHVFPTELINFDNAKDVNIMYGENAYVYGSNNNQNTQTIINLLNNCSADVKIYVNLSMADKNRIYLPLLKDCEILVSNLTEESEYSKKVANMAIERAKRMMELGKKVVVAVDDMLAVSSIDGGDMSVSKKLMSLAKFSDIGGISVVAIMPSDFDVFVLEKLIDKRFKISQTGEVVKELEG